MKYKSSIIEIGNDAMDLYHGVQSLILFNDSIADEMLKEISVIHKRIDMRDTNIEVGDTIQIGENKLLVTAVGHVALETFSNIGHITIKFTGSDKVNKLLNKNLPEGKLGAKSFDFSIPVGISYEYANFQLDARYNFGVTKVFDVEGSKAKNSVFQITLGYKFAL